MLQLVVERDGVVVGPPIDLAPGRLLIGASPDAAVRLPAADAAEQHAWLVHGDGAPTSAHCTGYKLPACGSAWNG